MHFSVLIGLVSSTDHERIFSCLDALHNQTATFPFEVILADRRNDAVSEQIRARYPDVKLIAAPPGTSLPELRLLALTHSEAIYVAVTEDHCVPPNDWLASLADTFSSAAETVVAVGGCVENGVADTTLDQATFLCEYSQLLPPVTEGDVPALPGMNIAYRRDILFDIDRDLLSGGFWETTVHPQLLADGGRFVSSNRIRISHQKKFDLSLFVRQRFIYSRYFSGLRCQDWGWPKRLIGTLACLLLPPLLLVRMTTGLRYKNVTGRESLATLPWLAVFTVIMAAGEMTGCLFGTGDSLNKIE